MDEHPEVWSADPREPTDAVDAAIMPLAQSVLTRPQADASAEKVFEELEARAVGLADPANAKLPVAPTLRLSDGDLPSALQLRLGLLEMLRAAVGLPCGCERKLRARRRARAAMQAALRAIHVVPRYLCRVLVPCSLASGHCVVQGASASGSCSSKVTQRGSARGASASAATCCS